MCLLLPYLSILVLFSSSVDTIAISSKAVIQHLFLTDQCCISTLLENAMLSTVLIFSIKVMMLNLLGDAL